MDPAGKPRTVIGPDDATEDLDAEPASGVVLSQLLDGGRPEVIMQALQAAVFVTRSGHPIPRNWAVEIN
jgi:hypothetical protein